MDSEHAISDAQIIDVAPAISQPIVIFAASEYSYGENGVPISAQITLLRDIAEGDSIVTVSFPGTGTATAGNDYNSTVIPVTFSGNELIKTIEIPIIQDNIVELDETLELSLSAVNNAAIGSQNSSTVTILNDDHATISINDVAKAEGTGNGRTYYSFTVTMSNPVDVQVTFSPGIYFKDPTEAWTCITNPVGPGVPFIYAIHVSIQKDSTVELDEQFLVTLSKIEASGRSIAFADNVGVGTILNDDQAIIAVNAADVIEGDSGTPKMVYTVTMDNEVDVPVTAMVIAIGSDATNGVDLDPSRNA